MGYLKRKTPLKRRAPLKQRAPLKRSSTPIRKTPIKKSQKKIPKKSAKQIARDRKYKPIRDAFLLKKETCEYPGCERIATDWHHMEGKIEDLLFDTSKAKALCREHHDIVERHPNQAKADGLSLNRIH